MVSFQVTEKLPPSRCTASSESSEPCSSALRVEVAIDDLYSTILFDSWRDQHRVLSMDRAIVAAIQHLHVISVPCGDEIGSLRDELIVNSHVNTLLYPCSSRPWGAATLEKKRSRQQLPHSTSQLFTHPIRATILIQSGLIWRNAYLLAEVALDNAKDTSYTETWSHQQSRRKLIQDIDYSLVVSVYNANSGYSSSRRLPPERVNSLLERIEALPSQTKAGVGLADKCISDQYTFAECLLAFLQLDVDLFGNEIIVFPVLEHAASSASQSGTRQASNGLATSPREFLPRRTSWEDENISEGDEEEYNDDEATELSTGVQAYDTDEEEDQDEAEELQLVRQPGRSRSRLDRRCCCPRRREAARC